MKRVFFKTTIFDFRPSGKAVNCRLKLDKHFFLDEIGPLVANLAIQPVCPNLVADAGHPFKLLLFFSFAAGSHPMIEEAISLSSYSFVCAVRRRQPVTSPYAEQNSSSICVCRIQKIRIPTEQRNARSDVLFI